MFISRAIPIKAAGCFTLAFALSSSGQAPSVSGGAPVPDVYTIQGQNNRTFPLQNTSIKAATAADITGMNGYVIDGQVHAHISMATPRGAVGGHLESGTNVFSFALVTLGVLREPVDLRRADDKDYR